MPAAKLGLSGRIGLALGSGAARGFAHVGVIRGLADAGVEPAIVCGTSMGAIVGAAHAAGRLDAFEAWARELEWRQIIRYVDLSFRGGLFDPRGLFAFFEESLAGRRIDSLELPFAAVGTDLANGHEVWMREGDLLAALRASIALPGLITPARWRDRWMVDGGLTNPVPISLCRALGADSVIAVDLNTTLLGRRLLPVHGGAPPEKEADAELSGEVALGARLNARLRELAADLRQRLDGALAEDAGATPSLYEVMANSVNIMQMRIARSRMAGDPPELLIAPRMQDYAILDFDRAEEAIEAGRRAVARAIAVHQESAEPE